MKKIILGLLILLAGCAANLTFIDRSDGNTYSGSTSATISGDGTATASIENNNYSGTWIYSANGGGYTLGTAFATSGTSSAFATGNSYSLSAQGNGLINMKSNNGLFLRCVFNFNTMSNKGTGECQRNDGHLYDLYVKR
ncbi:MAG TPA: hypothetical protein VNX00_04970 [Herbaspirillum sp.]|nr:hypothetical protein [Herbaspirillum sp.]